MRQNKNLIVFGLYIVIVPNWTPFAIRTIVQLVGEKVTMAGAHVGIVASIAVACLLTTDTTFHATTCVLNVFTHAYILCPCMF